MWLTKHIFYFSGGRLDYTKAHPELVLAYLKMIQDKPEMKDNSTLILLCPPGRKGIKSYDEEKEKLDAAMHLAEDQGANICFFHGFDGNGVAFLAQFSDVLVFASHADGFLCMGLEGMMSQVRDYDFDFEGTPVTNKFGAQLVQSYGIGAYEHVKDYCTGVADPKDTKDYANQLYAAGTLDKETVQKNTTAIQDIIADRLLTEKHWGPALSRPNLAERLPGVARRALTPPGARPMPAFEDFASALPGGIDRSLSMLFRPTSARVVTPESSAIDALMAFLQSHSNGEAIAAGFLATARALVSLSPGQPASGLPAPERLDPVVSRLFSAGAGGGSPTH